MRQTLIHLVAGTRPNFMKVAPLCRALEARSWGDVRLVHTGQHSSYEMSEIFIQELALRKPDISLDVRSGSHAETTARVMMAYEQELLREMPDLVVVVGDVNSTLACALAAKKLAINVAHLEAGLRSGDRSMPEEINRMAVDAISDILWPPSEDAQQTLIAEGVDTRRITCVGNAMIDTLVHALPEIRKRRAEVRLGLKRDKYVVATFHRPSNVDAVDKLSAVVSELRKISKQHPVVFPVHPRTLEAMNRSGLKRELLGEDVKLCEPCGYLDFLSLVSGSVAVVTDSGGIQEETSFLGIPCLTVRYNTERPITLTQGTNRLIKVGDIAAQTLTAARESRVPKSIAFWDGMACERIAEDLERRLIAAPSL